MKKSGPPFNRRKFIKQAALLAPLIKFSPLLRAAELDGKQPAVVKKVASTSELSADLVIIGGGLGGCAAALAAARNNLRVIITEETDWIGGQLTQQAVPPDENPWIESFGGTRSYLNLRQKIRDYYFQHYALTEKARNNPHLNPGNAWVSRLCHEPRVSLAVLQSLFAPYLADGKIRLLLRHRAKSASVNADRVEAVQVTDLQSDDEKVLRAPYFLDATEMGDLLPLTKTEFNLGAESYQETGEPHAPAKADPDDLQGFTMSFAVDYLPGENHIIDKPAEYDFWRNLPLKNSPQRGARLLSFDDSNSKKIGFDPAAAKGFWTYRRILDRTNFQPGTYASDVSLVNWGQNDYSLGTIFTPENFARHVARAKQQSLSLLYWLQTEAPLPKGGTGWKGLRLRPDIVGTKDGLVKYPYIRESRRIRAEFTVLEQHVSLLRRMRETHLPKEEVTAQIFTDSVGIGYYKMDVHATTGGGSGLYLDTLPFQIPLGALIPKRMENLLPACKNLGVTHLTNGCYRLHPIEWNIGESAGLLAVFCVRQKKIPREVRGNAALLRDFQAQLDREGVPIAWPKNGAGLV